MKDFRKQLLTRGGVTALGLLIMVTALFLIGLDISRRAKNIQDLKAKIASQIQAVQSLAALKEGETKATSQLSFLYNILPLKDQLINFPKDLKQLAVRHSINLDFRFGDEVAATQTAPGAIQFSATFRGSLENFTKFLDDIIKSKYFVSFSSFDIGGQQKDDYTLRTSGKVSFRQ